MADRNTDKNRLQTPFSDGRLNGIRLRAPEISDLSLLFNLENDPSLWLYGCNTGPYSRYQMEQYITQNNNDIYTDGQLRFMIVEDTVNEYSSSNESGKNEGSLKENVLGILDIFDFDARNSRAEVGVMIQKRYRGRGIARQALLKLHEHCFDFLGINQLYAYIIKDNLQAIKLFESCGYRYSGTLDSWIRRGSCYLDVCVYQIINKPENQ